MRRFSTMYPKIPSGTAGEAGKGPGLNTWVAMETVTLRELLEEKSARGTEWRRREWREIHRKIGEGGLRKEDGKAYRAIFFFWLELMVWTKVTSFPQRPFEEVVYCYMHETRGAGSNLIPCSALTECTNISPRVDILISNALRSVWAESRRWVCFWLQIHHICVWAICCCC